MIFVDTNYFLRFLLANQNKQHNQAKQLFMEGAEGRLQLTTSTIVLFEIYWVLSSIYEKKKEDIVLLLGKVLDLEFIALEGRLVLRSAIDIYRTTKLDLEDSYNIVLVENKKIKDFKTFDKELQKVFSDKSGKISQINQ